MRWVKNKVNLYALLFVSIFATIGCSSSNDNPPMEGTSTTGGESTSTAILMEDTDSAGGDTTSTGIPMDGTGTAGSDTTSTVMPTEDSQSAPNPSSQATTRVTFDITVPAYRSNELQVRLESGDLNATASFVSDESWSVSGVFPTNTDNFSVVTFADGNGAMTLGTAEIAFTTSTAASQTVQVTANQFNTERWDSDNDGVSNLDELIAGTNPDGDNFPRSVQASLEYIADKTFRISWGVSEAAEHYQVLEASTNGVGFVPVSDELDSTSLSFDHRVALYNRVNARYIVKACNEIGCSDSEELIVSGTLEEAIGNFTASDDEESLGGLAELSADGSTLAIRGTAGFHIFVRENENWQLQTLLSVVGIPSFSSNGDTLAIGVSTAGDITDVESPIVNESMFTASPDSGAVYVFTRMNGNWEQQVLLRASSPGFRFRFGQRVSISADGNTLAVSTPGEFNEEGAAYVFTRNDGSWQEQAYLKASNPEGQICNTERPECFRWGDAFGSGLDLSDDGNTLAIGAPGEDSAAVSINGDQGDNSSRGRGAVYVFVRNDETWQQQAYIKANFDYDHPAEFGAAVALSATGDTLAVGTPGDDSLATGINGVQSGFILEGVSSGAVYVFDRAGVNWQQRAFVKASNTDGMDGFGSALSLSADGNTLAVGASQEDSAAIGINGNQADNSADSSGAAYVLTRTAGVWQQQAYLKATDTEERKSFGVRLSLSADGQSLAVSGHRSSYLY